MKYIIILAFALSLTVCATAKTIKEEPFTVDFDSPKIQIGEFQAQFDKTIKLTGIRSVDISVSYYPLEDAVCLQYRIDFMTYYLFLDKEGRAAYLKALEQYKEDYDQRNLDTKGSRKTQRKYGKINSYLIWQAAVFTVRARANTDVELGYDMLKIDNKKAAFFCIYRRDAVYIDENSKQDRRLSPNTPMYLTRAQADELAALFDQNLLISLTPDTINKKTDNTVDSY